MNPCTRIFPYVLISLLLGVCSAGWTALNGDYLNKVEIRLPSPHEDWGKPCARGKVKVLFITSLVGAPRDIVELAQRFDMEWTVFTVLGSTMQNKPIGCDDEYYALVDGTSTKAKTTELLAKLDQRPDVIVFGNIDPARLPEECQLKVQQLIQQGTGLVRFSYMTGAPLTITPLKPAAKETADPDAPKGDALAPAPLAPQPVDPPTAVLASIPYSGLEDYSRRAAGYRKWATAKPVPVDEMFAQTIKAACYGEGRVIGFWYEESATDSYAYRAKVALTAASPDALDIPIQYDYYLRTAAEAILWAGKRDSRYAVTFGQPEGSKLARQDTKGHQLSFTVTPQADAPAAFRATARLRDALGTLLMEKAFPGGKAPLTAQVALPTLSAGTHYLEVVVSSAAGAETWPTQAFQVTEPRAITALAVSPVGMPSGQTVKARVTFGAAPGAGTRAEVMVLDAFDRIAAWRELPLAPDQVEQQIDLPYPYPVSAGNTLVLTVKDANGPVALAWTNFFTHRRDEYERFPSVIWGGGGGGYLDRLLYRNLRRAFFTSILGGTVVDRCDFTAVPTATYLQLHATKDGRTLNWLIGPEVFDPAKGDASVYNPAVQKELARQMQVCVERNADKGVFVYNLGDENGFQYAGGAGPFEVAAFRGFLKTRYAGDLKRLNACWGSGYTRWEDIVPMPLEEAIRRKRPAPYIDRCLFNEEAYAALHHYAADQVRKLDPDAKVGAEGSQSGDLERTVSRLEFWSPYASRLNNYLQKSVEPSRLVCGNWWGGYVGAYGRPRDTQEGGASLWGQVLSGFANSSWWFALDGAEGLLNPDLSFADYFVTGSLPYLREIGDGIGQQLNETRLEESGVYIYYSHPSVHASKVVTSFGNPEANADVALAVMETLGVQPGVITPQQVLAGKLDPARVKLLIMPAVFVLSPKEASGIDAYVKAGGRVIADIAPGILGAYGEMQAGGSLDALFGVTRSPLGTLIGPNLVAQLADHAPGDAGNKPHVYTASCQRPLNEWFTLDYLVNRTAKTWQLWQDGELMHTEAIPALESVSSRQPLGLGYNPGTGGFGGGSDGDFYPWKGEVAEILIYRSASDEQRKAVDAYLQRKYRPGAPANASTAPPPGMVLWLKADALKLNDGDPVATWMDASGRGHDAEALSLTIRPVFKANGLNGMPTVVFPGTDKRCGPGYDTNIKRPADVPAFEIANHADLQFGTESFAIYVIARCDLAYSDGATQPPTFLLGNQPVAWNNGGVDNKTFKLYVQATASKPVTLEAAEMRFAGALTDSTVRARPGVAFTGAPERPVMIINTVGKGQAMLLNFDLATATKSLTPETKDAWLTWWRTRVTAAGIAIPITLEGTQARVTRFSAPGIELVGVYQPKRDTVEQAVLHFTDGLHCVYDVIAGKYLGQTDRVSFNPGERRSRLYALLPQQAKPPTLAAKGCLLGNAISGTVDLGVRLPVGQRRVLRIETIDAKGHERLDLRRYPRVTAQQATFDIPVAFNDAPGEWTIAAVDIVTGQRASVKVKVGAGNAAPAVPGPWPIEVGLY